VQIVTDLLDLMGVIPRAALKNGLTLGSLGRYFIFAKEKSRQIALAALFVSVM